MTKKTNDTNSVSTAVKGLGSIIWGGIRIGIKYIVAFFTISVFSAFTIYMFLEFKPEYKEKLKDKLRTLDRLSDQINNATEEGKLNKIDMSEIDAALVTIGVKKRQAASLGNMPGIENVPSELAPFLTALQDSQNFPKYIKLLSKDRIGEHGEGAIPLLEKALRGNNNLISEAAEESLRAIGTPHAKEVVRKYKEGLYLLNKSKPGFDPMDLQK